MTTATKTAAERFADAARHTGRVVRRSPSLQIVEQLRQLCEQGDSSWEQLGLRAAEALPGTLVVTGTICADELGRDTFHNGACLITLGDPPQQIEFRELAGVRYCDLCGADVELRRKADNVGRWIADVFQLLHRARDARKAASGCAKFEAGRDDLTDDEAWSVRMFGVGSRYWPANFAENGVDGRPAGNALTVGHQQLIDALDEVHANVYGNVLLKRAAAHVGFGVDLTDDETARVDVVVNAVLDTDNACAPLYLWPYVNVGTVHLAAVPRKLADALEPGRHVTDVPADVDAGDLLDVAARLGEPDTQREDWQGMDATGLAQRKHAAGWIRLAHQTLTR